MVRMAQRTISLEHLFFIFMQCFLPQKNRPQKYVRVVICLWPVGDLDAPTPADQIFLNYMCFLVCIEWNSKRLGVSVYGKITINCTQNSATEFWGCLGYMTPSPSQIARDSASSNQQISHKRDGQKFLTAH